MADLRDFTGKNRKFTGTIGERISTGSTGERDTATFGAGTIRFNTTINLMEYYTGTEWKSIDAPPTITNFNIDGAGATTSSFIDRTLSGNTSIVITGSLYNAGAVVSFRGNGGANFDATTTTVTSASQITAVVPYSSFLGAQEPYSIRVTNLSGLYAQLDGCLSVDAAPVFNTASGSLGTITDISRSSYTLSSAAATDPDGDTITYSITSGALPAGLSLNSSTGEITGTASVVGSNTTSTFTVSAATSTQTATRSFSITVTAPTIVSYTSVSPFTFSVPPGTTTLRALVVGGGGGGGRVIGGGGGGGGFVETTSFPVTPGGSVSGSVGGGGGGAGDRSVKGSSGSNSTFGPITAFGGGGGGSHDNNAGLPGGSGGGGIYGPGGSSTQTSFPAVGGIGYGHAGGLSGPSPGAGGGGAGEAGLGPSPGGARNGGNGRTTDISGSSVTYAGGGGGGSHATPTPIPGGSGGGGPGPAGTGTPGTNGLGGGAGGGYHPPDYNGGTGGSGIVIIRY